MSADLVFNRSLLFQQAVEQSSGYALVLLDVQERILGWNSGATLLFGYEEEEITGQPIQQLYISENRGNKVLPPGSPAGELLHSAERCWLVRKNGLRIWAQVITTALYNSAQQLTGYSKLISETGEKRVSGLPLSATGEQFRAAFAHAATGMALTDLRGYLLHVNQAFCDLTGYLEHELLTKSFPDITHPDDRARTSALMESVVREERSNYVVEKRYLRKNGETVWVQKSVSLVRDAEGQPSYLVAITENITPRKEAEQQKNLLISVIENSPDFISIALPDGNTFFINKAGWKILGLESQEEVNRITIPEYFPPDERDRIRNVILPYVLQHGHWDGEMRFQNVHTKAETAVLWNVFLIRDPVTNEPVAIACVSRDITDRKRNEEKLRETQKLETIGVLAGGIAHDFNNLLTGIMGNSSLALEILPAREEAVSLIEDVLDASQRAASLTRQLLAYSGRGRAVIEKINLSQFVRRLVKLLRNTIAVGVDLQLELEESLVIEADIAQMQQVVMNLVINAAEAIGERSGFVLVRTSKITLDEKAAREFPGVTEISPGNYVSLEVADSGCGMDQQTRNRIFDPFFTTKVKGRGLGLSAILGIVRGHSGGIEVTSKLGEGTVFRILLPAVSGTLKHEHSSIKSPIRGKGTILVVDDESVVRRTAEHMLTKHGFHALLASNGQQALELIDQHPAEISLILLDMTMPGMSGEEMLEQLEKRAVQIPIVLSTGFSGTEAAKRFAGKAVAGFLEKPYPALRLIEVVQQFATKQSPE